MAQDPPLFVGAPAQCGVSCQLSGKDDTREERHTLIVSNGYSMILDAMPAILRASESDISEQ